MDKITSNKHPRNPLITLLAAAFGLSSLAATYLLYKKYFRTKTIKIFDFDGTIFRSPMPSHKIWSNELLGILEQTPQNGGLGWFQETDTLDEPCVPRKPSKEWYNEDIVNEVKKSMSDPNCITILLTGRNENYRTIVTEIVNHYGMKFDEMGFKPANEVIPTMTFKLNFIVQMLQKYKTRKIQLWEDRPKHANGMEKFLIDAKYDVKVHLIESVETRLPREVEVELVKKLISKNGKELKVVPQVSYTGVHLHQESRSRLLKAFPVDSDWTAIAEHMTIKLGGVTEEEQKLYDVGIGKEVELQVIAFGKSDKAMAVQVRGAYSWNKIAHVTLGVSSIGKPKDSNMITEWKAVDEKITLKGKIQEYNVYGIEKPVTPKKETGKKLSSGKIVKECFPTIENQSIGKAVAIINKWMDENKVSPTENEENIKKVKEFIEGSEEIKKFVK